MIIDEILSRMKIFQKIRLRSSSSSQSRGSGSDELSDNNPLLRSCISGSTDNPMYSTVLVRDPTMGQAFSKLPFPI